MKLLVVDDDQMMLDFAERVLASLGYSCVTARDGTVALQLLEQDCAIGALIVDLRMGNGPNGAQIARQALTMRPQLHVILTSGDHRLLQIAGKEIQQAVDLLPKPFRRRDVASLLSRLL